MRKQLNEVTLEDLKGKTFEIINAVELLCEVCSKPLKTREKLIRRTLFITSEDFNNLQNRSKPYDRIEVDIENTKIYLCSHDYPGDIHEECLEKLG